MSSRINCIIQGKVGCSCTFLGEVSGFYFAGVPRYLLCWTSGLAEDGGADQSGFLLANNPCRSDNVCADMRGMSEKQTPQSETYRIVATIGSPRATLGENQHGFHYAFAQD